MGTELRVVVALGLAVAAWLFIVPTASADGSSCGVPALNAVEGDGEVSGLDVDCEDRNQTRVKQSVATAAGAAAIVGLHALRQLRAPDRPPREPPPDWYA